MNDKQNNNTSIVGSGGKARKPLDPKVKLLLKVAGLIIIGILIGLLVSKLATKETAQESNTNTPKEVSYEETVTPNAYGNFLSVALRGFYLGGNTNGVDIPAHNYYPSAADLKNREWTKQNMQLDDRMHELITSGEVVYEPKGCNAGQPSSDQNKCTEFVVKSGDTTLYDSTKKE